MRNPREEGRPCPLSVRFVAVALSGALLTACVNVDLEESDIYRPQPGAALTAEALNARAPGYRLEPQVIAAADGLKLAGVLLRRPGADRTVLYFGGNLTTVGGNGPAIAAQLAPLNVNLMLVDYRGYGASGKAQASTASLMSDALAVFDHLAGLPGIDARSVVVHGQSLGSFMAGQVAASRPTAGVVLESSATTAEEFAEAGVPVYARPFVRLRIAEGLRGQGNLKQMDRLDEPLLILVGAEDDATPAVFSRRLFEASTLPAARKGLVVVEGVGHNGVLNRPAAMKAYAEFLARTR
jgi:hypothetical protein